jgi:hypothetical protein
MWDIDMPLLSNRFFLYDLGKVLLGSWILFMAAYVPMAAASGNLRGLGSVMLLMLLCLLIVLFLFVWIALLFFRNVYPVRYLISTQGIGWEMLSRRGKIASRLAIVAGILAGKPGVAGAGLLSAARESGLIEWSQVRKIKTYPAIGVINVMNNWRVVMRIFCAPDDYPLFIEWLRWGAPAAQYRELGAPPSTTPTGAPDGSFGLELIRRCALLAATCLCLWLVFWTPPVILKVVRTDFAGEFARKYGERTETSRGVTGLARQIIRRNTNPGSLDAYVKRTTEGYLIHASGGQWADLYGRTAQKPAFFHVEDPPVAEILPQIQGIHQRGWLSSYLAVPAEGPLAFLEIRYQDRPRESQADASLIFPKRAASWIWLAAGLIVYLLLPWPRQSHQSLTGDRTSIIVVDLLGMLFGAFFFSLPLYLAHFTAEVLGSESGTTWFCWFLALTGVGLLIWSARLGTRREQQSGPGYGFQGKGAS